MRRVAIAAHWLGRPADPPPLAACVHSAGPDTGNGRACGIWCASAAGLQSGQVPECRSAAISKTNFSLLDWEARTAQQTWGDAEAEAKYDILVNCYLCGKQLRAGSRWGVCEPTPECRREHRRPSAR